MGTHSIAYHYIIVSVLWTEAIIAESPLPSLSCYITPLLSAELVVQYDISFRMSMTPTVQYRTSATVENETALPLAPTTLKRKQGISGFSVTGYGHQTSSCDMFNRYMA